EPTSAAITRTRGSHRRRSPSVVRKRKATYQAEPRTTSAKSSRTPARSALFMTGLVGLETVLVQAERTDLGFEGRPRKAQFRRRAGRSRHAPFGLRKRGFYHRPFPFPEGVAQRLCGRRRLRRSSGQPTRVDGEQFAIGDDHGAFDHILQLADIARPGIRLQQLERLAADPG